MTIYLDFNATTPVDPRVLDEMIRVYTEDFGNAGSRTHVFGQRASKLVETARQQVADLFGVQRGEVLFTSGATEANNLAILGLAAWGRQNGKMHIVTSAIEHKAVLEPVNFLEQQGFEVDRLSVGRSGRVDPGELMARVRDDTLLVSVMHANNETGVIQPVEEIGKFLTAREDVYFHIDAAQTAGKLVSELRVVSYDLLSISAHKMYGPQGVGALICRRRGRSWPPIRPLSYGGGQERGLRPGTLPVALIAGFGKAAAIALQEHEEWFNGCQTVKNWIKDQISALNVSINGDSDYCMPNCINVSFSNVDSEALMVALQDQLAISNGSACTSSEYRPSHVLTAMGLETHEIESAVRISWGRMDQNAINLAPLVKAVRALAG